ncbi:hypothetical protein KFE25_004787 [Diacronema lutheri]|uniref:Heme NO-binding domain-containing protein n=2 Tax=Diacronema lutheri TaxID=2081491 RepID=A0A8J5XCZ6_DIALT|nr:hypothetical protein KFE25_004787 [Diacronema lutheri]
MHGLVHLALRAFVADDAAWQSVLREAGVVNEDAILDAVQYADATTLALFRATAAERNLDPSAALDALGEYFVEWLAEMGHMRMLDALGTTLDDVLCNVNTLHHTLWRTHRGAHFPIFKVDGRSADGTLVISYASSRGATFAPFAAGVVRAVARLKTGALLEMRRLSAPHAGFDATWTCTLVADNPPPAPSPNARARTAREVRVSRGWHHALVESCCAGALPAPPAPKPRARWAWWTRVVPVLHRESMSAVTGACSSGARSSSAHGLHSSSEAVASEATATRWMPLRTMSLTAFGRVAQRVSNAASISTHSPEGPTFEQRLDQLLLALPGLADPGAALMRAVRCGKVAADFANVGEMARTSAFWRTNVGTIADYELSAPASFATRFVSHTWLPPADWRELMGAKLDYSDVKAAVLASAARDVVWERRRHVGRARVLATGVTAPCAPSATESPERAPCASSAADDARLAQQPAPIERWQDVTLWVDKCCVAQQHPIMVPTIAMLEQFVRRCEGMIVLFTWDFFERLWCVYEWALFLVLHDTEHVQLCVDFFLSERTLQRYVAAIREFKLARARTYYASDLELIRERIEAMYQSVEHFERFVQLAVIVHVAVVLAKRASPIPEAASAENDLLVWARLAAELGFAQLADVLARARPAAWLAHAAPAEGGGVSARMRWMVGGKTWRAHLAGRVDSWYQRELKPLLRASRALAVRPAFLGLKSPSPLTSGDWQAAAHGAYVRHFALSVRIGDAHEGQIAHALRTHRESTSSLSSLMGVEADAEHGSDFAAGELHASVDGQLTPSRRRNRALQAGIHGGGRTSAPDSPTRVSALGTPLPSVERLPLV